MKLTWIDRLLIKVALAKAAARGCLDIHLADRLTAAIKGFSYMPEPLTAGTTVSTAVSRSNEIEEPGPIAGQEKDRFPLFRPQDCRQALEIARHELTTLHGLTAADGAALSETWTIDTSAVTQVIDAVLNEAS